MLPFERAVLAYLTEIPRSEILPAPSDEADPIKDLEAQVADVKAAIEEIKRRKVTGAMLDLLEQKDAEKQALEKQLAEAKLQADTPVSAALDETLDLIGYLDTAADPEEARTTLIALMVVVGVLAIARLQSIDEITTDLGDNEVPALQAYALLNNSTQAYRKDQLRYVTALDAARELVAGDDAAEVVWVPLVDLGDVRLVEGLHEFLVEVGVAGPGIA